MADAEVRDATDLVGKVPAGTRDGDPRRNALGDHGMSIVLLILLVWAVALPLVVVGGTVLGAVARSLRRPAEVDAAELADVIPLEPFARRARARAEARESARQVGQRPTAPVA